MLKKYILNSLQFMSKNTGKSIEELTNEALEEYIRKYNHPFANIKIDDHDTFDVDYLLAMGYIRLDTKLLNNIEAIAHASHKSVAKVINELLEKEVKQHDTKSNG